MIGVDAYLVDWDRLVEEWQAQGGDLEIGGGEEDEGGWIETYDPPEWPYEFSRYEAFDERYKVLRASLPDEPRKSFDRFLGCFGVLFFESEWNQPASDLGSDVPQEVAVCTMNPATVEGLLSDFEALDLGAFQAAATASAPADVTGPTWFPQPEDLLAFIDALGEMLATAKRLGKGVVVWVG